MIDRSVAAEKVRLPLVSPRVFCDVDGGNCIQTASLDHAIESAVRLCTLELTWFAASDVTGVLAGFSADLDDGHIPAWCTTNCML